MTNAQCTYITGLFAIAAIGVGSFVGILVVIWAIQFGYKKHKRSHRSPITRGVNDTLVATGIDVPFNIDVDDLIERYRALGGEI